MEKEKCVGKSKTGKPCRFWGHTRCMTCKGTVCGNHCYLAVITSPKNLWQCMECNDAAWLLEKINK